MSNDLLDILDTDVIEASRRLLGCDLVFGAMRARIVETEAYRAADDPACHAYRGCTPRNAVMFGPAGFAYVYFTYGNHWMLNVVAHGPEDAAAVLIRAAEPLEGLEEMWPRRPKAQRYEDLLSGPGKLCAAMAVDRSLNGVNLLDPNSSLRLEPNEPVSEILVGTRIGITQGADLPWRFIEAPRLRWASKPWPR